MRSESIKNTDDLFYVGIILDAHGVKGEVKVQIISDHRDRLSELEAVYVISRDEKLNYGLFAIESLRGFENSIVKLKGIDDRDQALALKSAYLAVSREMTYAQEKCEYFVKDLIGLKVFDTSNCLLGEIVDITDTGSSDLFVIARENKQDLLLPAIAENIVSVNLPAGKIVVSLPAGLLDIYE